MISERQQEILGFIEAFVDERGYPPTHEEIRRGLDISTKSLVSHHLEALETAGCLNRVPNTPRGIRLNGSRRNGLSFKANGWRSMFSIPSNGHQTNAQTLAFDELESDDVVELTRSLVVEDEDVSALKVRGQALVDALVNEGDIVVIKRQDFAKNGEMVAVRLQGEDETRLRYYFRDARRGYVRLQPASPLFEPILADPATVQVQGKVVAIIRQVT
ncbi:MAG: transcriptional repressor LexA [Anaerolineae bacterium]